MVIRGCNWKQNKECQSSDTTLHGRIGWEVWLNQIRFERLQRSVEIHNFYFEFGMVNWFNKALTLLTTKWCFGQFPIELKLHFLWQLAKYSFPSIAKTSSKTRKACFLFWNLDFPSHSFWLLEKCIIFSMFFFDCSIKPDHKVISRTLELIF